MPTGSPLRVKTMEAVQTITTHDLGVNKKQSRLWLNSRITRDAGMAPGQSIEILFDEVGNDLVIKLAKDGPRTVVDTNKGGVIDINNSKLTKQFSGFNKVQVIPSPGQILVKAHHHESQVIEREATIKRRLKTGQPLRKSSLFSGLGLLDRSITRGLTRAGVKSEMVFVNEYDHVVNETNLIGNELWKEGGYSKDCIVVNDDIYTMDMRLVPQSDILVMGSPCPPFSSLNTQNPDNKDIFHPEFGMIFQPILTFIQASNTALVVLENIPRVPTEFILFATE